MQTIRVEWCEIAYTYSHVILKLHRMFIRYTVINVQLNLFKRSALLTGQLLIQLTRSTISLKTLPLLNTDLYLTSMF